MGKTFNFQKLTPSDDIDLGAYKAALDYAFDEKDLKNIALTGPYGSGKSSIVKTYEKNSDKNFIYISLAYFEETANGGIATTGAFEDKDEKGEQLTIENVLEGKILNQLLHQIKDKNIEQTDFKVKVPIDTRKIMKEAVLVLLFLVLALYVWNFNSWNTFLLSQPDSFWKEMLLLTVNPYFLTVAAALCCGLFVYGVYCLIRLQKSKNVFRKLNIEGNEVEIFHDTKESFFDRYLNEVLYLFENCDADVIVFEDIDRYGVVRIFERLREINVLINAELERRKKQPLRFLYLLRDDIFLNKDRTKFFDFIIPVIPVLNGSNANEQFKQLFKEADIADEFDTVFLRDVSVFVDEMRLLQNIFNEFLIYYHKLDLEDIDKNKLLAMVIYKNIFPKDFSDLLLRQGYVYQVLDKKEKYIETEIKAIDKMIQEKQERLEEIDAELVKDLDELDAIYLQLPYNLIMVNGKEESSFAKRIDFVRELKKYPEQIKYSNGGAYSSWRTCDFKGKYKELTADETYVERKEHIESKLSGIENKLRDEIEVLEEKKKQIRYKNVSELITDEELNNLKYINLSNKENSFLEIKTNPYYGLIKYLLRNGYIDESYPDYLSYFYEGSISRIEKDFLLSILNKKSKGYDFEIAPSENLLSKLSTRDFIQQEILNYSLLEFMLKRKNEYSEYIELFMQQIKEQHKLDFIAGFIEYTKQPAVFVSVLNELWPLGISILLVVPIFSELQKNKFALYTLGTASDEQLSQINSKNVLKRYVSEHVECIYANDLEKEKIINSLITLKVCFKSVYYQQEYKDIFREVYEHNLYAINRENILIGLKYLYQIDVGSDFEHRAVSTILTLPNNVVVQYCKMNMEAFVKAVAEESENIEDEEHIVIDILNNQEISEKVKKAYWLKANEEIVYLNTINDVGLFDFALENKKVRYSEENILEYFARKEEWNKTLRAFVEEDTTVLRFHKAVLLKEYTEENYIAFWKAVLVDANISNKKYEEIISSMGYCYKQGFEFEDISNDKVRILISNNVILMTAMNLVSIRKKYPSVRLYYIEKNIVEYISVIEKNPDVLDKAELVKLLDTGIQYQYKYRLLDMIDGEVSVIGKNYSLKIKEKILLEHFDAGDLGELLKQYDFEKPQIQQIIFTKAIMHIDEITAKRYAIPWNLTVKLLDSDKIGISDKQKIFIPKMNALNQETIIEYLQKLELREYVRIFEGKNPKFDITDLSEEILTIFKKRLWITSFKETDDGYYQAFAKKNKSKCNL